MKTNYLNLLLLGTGLLLGAGPAASTADCTSGAGSIQDEALCAGRTTDFNF